MILVYNIKLLEKAKRDIKLIEQWYEQQDEGLGELFIKKLLSTINGLQSYPHYQIRYRNVICRSVSSFPVSVHYSIEEDKKLIKIKAVFHHRQNSENWIKNE